MPTLASNEQFADRYILIDRIGTGGFSEVWKAKRSSGFVQAIKIFTSLDEEGVSLARHEFERVFNLNHQRILTASDFGIWKNCPYLVMPYCKNGSALKQIGKIDEKQLMKVILDISSALEYIHGLDNLIIHQDVKPDNFLIDDYNNYMLSDFGISKNLKTRMSINIHSNRLTQATGGAPIDSLGAAPPSYRPPERFAKEYEKRRPVKANDIWALGASLFELATGETPFGELGGAIQMQTKEVPDLPKDQFSNSFNQLIQWCLQLEPWDRPRADELKSIADHFLKTGDYKAIPNAQNNNHHVRNKNLDERKKGTKVQNKKFRDKTPQSTIQESPHAIPAYQASATKDNKKGLYWLSIISLFFTIGLLILGYYYVFNSPVVEPITKKTKLENTSTSTVTDSEPIRTEPYSEMTTTISSSDPLENTRKNGSQNISTSKIAPSERKSTNTESRPTLQTEDNSPPDRESVAVKQKKTRKQTQVPNTANLAENISRNDDEIQPEQNEKREREPQEKQNVINEEPPKKEKNTIPKESTPITSKEENPHLEDLQPQKKSRRTVKLNIKTSNKIRNGTVKVDVSPVRDISYNSEKGERVVFTTTRPVVMHGYPLIDGGVEFKGKIVKASSGHEGIVIKFETLPLANGDTVPLKKVLLKKRKREARFIQGEVYTISFKVRSETTFNKYLGNLARN